MAKSIRLLNVDKDHYSSGNEVDLTRLRTKASGSLMVLLNQQHKSFKLVDILEWSIFQHLFCIV